MKKIRIIVIAMLVLIMSATALAENISPRSSNYFTSYGTAVSHQGGGTLLITFTTVATDIADQLGVATYTVEKKTDEGWVNVSGALSGQTGSGVVSYTYSRYFFGVPGETYRVNVTFVCSMNGGMEHKTHTSGIVTAD